MDITVIVPIHEYSEEIKTLLQTALDSVEQQEKNQELPEVMLVYKNSIKEDVDGFLKEFKTKLTITPIENDGDSSYQAQVNLGVSKTQTNYFTILEFDDELSSTFFNVAIKNIEAFDDVDLFIPIVVETRNDQRGIKLTNTVTWTRQFVGENGTLGFMNSSVLSQYSDFIINGGIFKKEEFDAVGGLKSNIKLAFTYEFLLRMINNGAKIYTIPKIGYKHLVEREGALFTYYSKNMNVVERKFWFNTAKKEANFFKDREIDLSVLNA